MLFVGSMRYSQTKRRSDRQAKIILKEDVWRDKGGNANMAGEKIYYMRRKTFTTESYLICDRQSSKSL